MDRFGFDIFGKVGDNFGDIGVCWRLARQLARTSGVKAVRLWVDDLHSFARIEPRLGSRVNPEPLEGVEFVHWTSSTPDLAPHEVVVEAFACDPPASFIERMIKQARLWFNLKYLSAEPWVESRSAEQTPELQSLLRLS